MDQNLRHKALERTVAKLILLHISTLKSISEIQNILKQNPDIQYNFGQFTTFMNDNIKNLDAVISAYKESENG